MVSEHVPRDPPSGVWLEYSDGVRYENLPLIWVEVDEHDVDIFEVIPPREEHPVASGADVWPGKTGLRLPWLKPRREIND
jgi:hypothetical protein